MTKKNIISSDCAFKNRRNQHECMYRSFSQRQAHVGDDYKCSTTS